MAKRMILWDKLDNKRIVVHVSSINKIKKDSISYPETKEVIFGRIDGQGEEFAFRVPIRYTIISRNALF